MKRISLEELLGKRKQWEYREQHRYIMELLEAGKVKPLKASKTNGKKPALYREYWLLEEKQDYGGLIEELTYQLVPAISTDYYLSHLEVYQKERPFVLLLNTYLREHRELLLTEESVNERSFEIWGWEKFIKEGRAKTVLKHCGVELSMLHMYETSEPLAYYSHTREVPQSLLIVENKDTFYSMRRHLLEGHTKILGGTIGTLIYGGGKRIFRSFGDFELCVEPYMTDAQNTLLYFGDLDYEGIGIWEHFSKLFKERWEIRPFLGAYEAMHQKAAGKEALPKMKEQQSRNISPFFFSYFSEDTIQKMQKILRDGTYVPQEILNITDF